MRDNLDNSVNSSAASPSQREYRAEVADYGWLQGVTTMLTVEMPLADPGRDLPRKI